MKFRPGTEERLSVTIFEPTDDIKVQARLLWKDEVIAETEKFIFGMLQYRPNRVFSNKNFNLLNSEPER